MDEETVEKEVKDLERVCGKVVGFIPKNVKMGVQVVPEGLKLPETYWANMTSEKQVVCRDGGVLKIEDNVVFDFSKNVREAGGFYKNVEGLVERVDLKGQPAASNLPEREPMTASTGEVKPSETASSPHKSQETGTPFKPASKLSLMDDIKAEVGVLQAAAIEVTNGNLQSLKLELGEKAWAALVNTVLIQMARSYDKRGQYIKK